MTPTWQSSDGRHAMYLGDCLDVLPTLRGTDAVVTDIPYAKVNRESQGLRNLDKGVADVRTFTEKWAAQQSAAAAKSVYIWCGTEQVSELRSTLVDAGMTTRLCGWEKSNASPMNGEHLWLSSFECCVFGRHGGAYFARHCASPIWRGPIEREQKHPTQKPVWLMRELVDASTPYGGTVIDFCMGSGTTGIACIRTGRRFIGIEKEPKYFDIAVRRMESELAQGRLFEQEASS